MAYKTPIGTTPNRLIYGKACHLPVELEYRAYWAIKQLNFDHHLIGPKRKLQLNELDEWRTMAYENSFDYKERVKESHDRHIKQAKCFQEGDQVLLFNSRLRLFPSKLKSRWHRPYSVTHVFPHGAVEISHPQNGKFKVNGQRLKHYFPGNNTLPKNGGMRVKKVAYKKARWDPSRSPSTPGAVCSPLGPSSPDHTSHE
ncbi:uncharacterized protein LOC120272276 [Dioscorea cayenensis subsp. rotundata]|uniref:Uncharacterized protein LOC120272276 n=1 Tax=Dioscorea cayennensis subsp. rotundata TaxID=55577 RepID=A0AB40C957_DIOCR|nr:uncharacterized protein LOC120272276 [Dioscorea cayenensis subsp. rotundata]